MKSYKLWFLLVLLTPLLIGASDQDLSTKGLPSSVKQKSKPAKQARIAQDAPAEAVQPVSPAENARTNPKKNGPQKEPESWYDYFWPPIWSNWALVIITFLGVKIALRTVKAIEKQVNVAVNQAEAARIAAEATQKNTSIAEAGYKLATRSYRAFIEITFPNPVSVNSESGAVYVEYKITNSGKTEARIKNIDIDVYVGHGLPLIRFKPREPDIPGFMILFKQESRTVEICRSVPEERRCAIGELFLFIYGIILYDDIFGIGHYTRFCYLHDPQALNGQGGFLIPAQTVSPEDLANGWYPCIPTEYNDAD